jgi:ribosome biogenesis SPOUT family RNA methylase Rps3
MEGLSTTLACEQVEVVDPATGDVVGTVPEATREEYVSVGGIAGPHPEQETT